MQGFTIEGDLKSGRVKQVVVYSAIFEFFLDVVKHASLFSHSSTVIRVDVDEFIIELKLSFLPGKL